jgi:hypothetical protein
MTKMLVALALWLSQPIPDEKPRIDLFWSDYGLLTRKLSVGARKTLEREARSILADAGIELTFFIGSPEDHGRGDASAVRVILMPRSAEGWDAGGNAMGAILETNAQVPTVYILVPVVERTIGLAVEANERIHDGRRAQALARALARVLAHETVHAIDADIPHGPDGSIMSENLSRKLLLGERLSIHETTANRLRTSQRFGDVPREK